MKRNFAGLVLLLLAGVFTGTLQADIFVRGPKGAVLYQYSNGIMYQGPARDTKRLFRFERDEIRNMQGKRLALWKVQESALYDGGGGRVMYVYADKGGHPGSKGARAVIFIDGRKIYHGNGPGGTLILYPDSPLPVPVALYLAHTVTGGKPPKAGKVNINFATVPYGYYLGPKGTGKILLSLRGNKIYFNDKASGKAAYTFQPKGIRFYRGDSTEGEPAFTMANNGTLYKGGKIAPDKLAMNLVWLNCYEPGKTGTDSFCTVLPGGNDILTAGYIDPRKPSTAGKKVLLSSTLPNNRVPLAMRIFLAYLTQLDPEFKAHCQSQK